MPTSDAIAATAAPPLSTRQRRKKPESPPYGQLTPIEYGGLQTAFDHFNRELFGGTLPDVFLTYQRQAHSAGYFAYARFRGRVGDFGRDEIALNPDAFVGRSDEAVCSTLVHEMVHVWQQYRGRPPSRGYHNRQWAEKMKAIGLQPSNTGMPGGKITGARMSHYVIEDGDFAQSFARLATTGWKLNLQSAHRPGPTGGRSSKTKFTCLACGQNCWGKPDLLVNCNPCGLIMVPEEAVAGL